MTTDTEALLKSRRPWQVGFLATGLGVAVNLLIWLVGRALGVAFAVRLSSTARPVAAGAASVAAFTLVSLAIGTAVAVAASGRPRALARLQVAGAAVTLVSLVAPLSVIATTPTKVSLAAMHLVAGAVYVGALRWMGLILGSPRSTGVSAASRGSAG